MNVGIMLTIEEVRDIRKLLAEGMAPKTIAYQFNRHVNTIYNIKRNSKWEGV